VYGFYYALDTSLKCYEIVFVFTCLNCRVFILSLQSWWEILVFSGNFICVSDLGFRGVGNWKYYGIATQVMMSKKV